MMRIAICDDDVKAACTLESMLHELPLGACETEVFSSGGELAEQYRRGDRYQFILLDIEMPSMNGIETARQLRETDRDVVLIFVTAHREYVYQVFEALPFRFLEKPVLPEKLQKAVLEGMRYLEERKGFFSYKKGNAVISVPAREILYLEASNRKIILHTQKGQDDFYGRFRLTARQLDPGRFLQIHTSYIVNMDFLNVFRGREVVMEGNILLPVSLKYAESARTGHLRFLERRSGGW